MGKRTWPAVAVVLVLFAIAYIGSPFWAARQFRDAALSADADRLDATVDFPAVRESLKSQVNAAMTTKMQADPELKSNPFAGLGMMLIPAMVGKMVDTMVTPDGLSALMKQGRVERGGRAPEANPDVDYDYDYRGVDRFAVAVKTPGTADAQVPRFVFERRGLFSWKVIRLEIPDSVFAQPRN